MKTVEIDCQSFSTVRNQGGTGGRGEEGVERIGGGDRSSAEGFKKGGGVVGVYLLGVIWPPIG